ncbi:MAG: YdeI/OmpD-associated family protein [Eubacterium sp.]
MIHTKIKDSVAEVISKPYVFPTDILDAIKADPTAWKNYKRFPQAYKRIRVAYIDAARKRPKEFEKKAQQFYFKNKRE